MKKNEKPAPDGSSTEDGQQMQLDLGASDQLKQDYTPTPGLISSLLSTGEVNAVPLSFLVSITGLEEREIRHSIQRERLAGVPILANCHTGYFLPANTDERDRCVRSMRHRAAEIEKTARAIATAEVGWRMNGG